MTDSEIRFDDGDAYDRAMGVWSRLVGEQFLDWLAPPAGLRWVDVGCGTGAFTELLLKRCAPAEVLGIDPSEAQLATARRRLQAPGTSFVEGDAQAIPFSTDRFDAATMALVIFFLADPARGISDMTRVVRPGGLIATYAWDIMGGGFPWHPVNAELSQLGIATLRPPSAHASEMPALHGLWSGAGLEAIQSQAITVERSFPSFDEFWNIASITSTLKPVFAAMAAETLTELKARVQSRLPPDAAGRVAYTARANAIQGRVRK